MNELVLSDPELYAADVEDNYKPKKKKAQLQNYLNNNDINARGMITGNAATDDVIFADLFIDDEISLEDPEEGREKLKVRKEEDSKIHNSFTGPYPLDPTEFSHTDKGENYQFTTVVKKYNQNN